MIEVSQLRVERQRKTICAVDRLTVESGDRCAWVSLRLRVSHSLARVDYDRACTSFEDSGWRDCS